MSVEEGQRKNGKKMKVLGPTEVCKSLTSLSDEQLRKNARSRGLPELKDRKELLQALVGK